MKLSPVNLLVIALAFMAAPVAAEDERPRFREAVGPVGVLPTGPLNAITDVEGVTVGHVTLIEGERIRTGVTAILPHGGNLYQDKTPAGFYRANGYGKFAGSTQIDELGEIETPIVLTNTLNVAEGMAGIIEWTLAQPGNELVRSVNAVVGETNDGYLNDIRRRAVSKRDVINAIKAAKPGPVAEGNVGAGTGTRAFGYKGGIGTSSRQLPEKQGGYRVGVLVQSNYGRRLIIQGMAVDEALQRADSPLPAAAGDGSIIIVVATDAPLSDRNLERLAKRAVIGLARTGSHMRNGSGDYVIAFSTAAEVRRSLLKRSGLGNYKVLSNARQSPLYQAVAEATEEAIYNSLFKARTLGGKDGHRLPALPAAAVADLLKRRGG